MALTDSAAGSGSRKLEIGRYCDDDMSDNSFDGQVFDGQVSDEQSFNDRSFDAERLKTIRQSLIQLSLQTQPVDLTQSQKETVREALLWLNENSEYQTLGICADSLAEAEAALMSYVSAISQPIRVDIPARSGAVFLKFNTLKNAWYIDSYSGDARGVLVTYHTSEPEEDEVNGTYGPFPLDLFD